MNTKRVPSRVEVARWKQLAVDIVRLKQRAGEVGLYRTMHALEEGVKAVGWEIAGLLDGTGRPGPLSTRKRKG